MNEYIEYILSTYGWLGIGLTASLLFFFVMQMCYYVGNYRTIAKYKDSSRPEIRHEIPPVSVIVPLFTDDYPFLDERLPLYIAQEGVEFEVVIVYVGSNNDFYDDIQRLHQMLPNVVVTRIQTNPQFPISIKTALNIGIKAANHECMIFTSPDCYPLSERWLSLMASGFKRGDVVLGYTGLESDKGVGRYFMRAHRMMGSAVWLSRAIKGKPYRGHYTNIGWTKSQYYEAKGFSHLNMHIGVDDLYIQRLLSKEVNPPHVSVVVSPRAALNQICWGSIGWWTEQFRFFRSGFKFYPFRAKLFERWELRSRVLFGLLTLLSVILLPLKIKIGAIVLFIIRAIVVSLVVKKIAKRLGEGNMIKRYGMADILIPLYVMSMDIWLRFKHNPKVWSRNSAK
ncbi:MAG: glycosyltransferase [Rikenellaceae bacterium]